MAQGISEIAEKERVVMSEESEICEYDGQQCVFWKPGATLINNNERCAICAQHKVAHAMHLLTIAMIEMTQKSGR